MFTLIFQKTKSFKLIKECIHQSPFFNVDYTGDSTHVYFMRTLRPDIREDLTIQLMDEQEGEDKDLELINVWNKLIVKNEVGAVVYEIDKVLKVSFKPTTAELDLEKIEETLNTIRPSDEPLMKERSWHGG